MSKHLGDVHDSCGNSLRVGLPFTLEGGGELSEKPVIW